MYTSKYNFTIRIITPHTTRTGHRSQVQVTEVQNAAQGFKTSTILAHLCRKRDSKTSKE